MRPWLLALPLLAVSASALAQDIPWFEAHPAERRAMLKRCRDDYRLARTALCANAETAEARASARQRAPGWRDPDPPSGMLREGARRACARPPSERGLLGAWCDRI
jgi:hypothetical protein